MLVNMNLLKTAEDYIMVPFTTRLAYLKTKTEIMYKASLIQGKTGQGKTHLTAHKMIPALLDEGKKLVIVSAPSYGILDINMFKKGLAKYGDVKVVTDADEALHRCLLNRRTVLVTIHPNIISRKGRNFIAYLNNLLPNEYSIFIDEAHTWLVPHHSLYKGCRGHRANELTYKGALYKVLETCKTNYLFWLTATPTNVQTGKLTYDGKLQCEIINEMPPKHLTVDKLACLGNVEYYDPELTTNYLNQNGDETLMDISIKVLAMLHRMRELELRTGIKQTMLVRTANNDSDDIFTNPHMVRKILDKLVELAGYEMDDMLYGVTNQLGITLESPNDALRVVSDDITLQSYFDDNNHPVRIMLVIDKCYQGMSVNSMKNIVVWRTSTQADANGEPILDFGTQIAGRGSRPYAGEQELGEDHTFDSLKHLPLEEKKDIIEANTCYVILPDTPQAHEVGQLLEDKILSSVEEFTEYFIDEDLKGINFVVDEEVCDHCGAAKKYWRKDLVKDVEINVEEMDKLFAA